MFTEATLDFLRDLEAHNTRAWFSENRRRYEVDLRQPAQALAARLASDLAGETGLDHRAKIFRIHRDLRFSKDRTPYTTHVHMSFTPTGSPGALPAWMLGLSPVYFTLGCGVMGFDKAGLTAFRERVAGPGGGAVAETLDAMGRDGIRMSEPELKRVPAPWQKDHPRADLLRCKSIVAWLDAEGPEAGIGPGMPERAMQGFARLRPLFDLLMPA